ncbi:MAG: ArnT family glycosyltransferase [Jatrophihabitans sp.]
MPDRTRVSDDSSRSTLPPLARGPVIAAVATIAVVLTAVSNGYGFHRDELYFRMLRPAWGYVDQPPLTPLIARLFRQIADEPWAVRIPATLCAAASVAIVALITREVGGGRLAQTLCAWGYASASAPLLFGHVFLTSSLDLVVWPLVLLLIIRAVLRDQPRWWLGAGVVTGVSMYNKLLIAGLLLSLAVALAIVGPRRLLTSKWVLGSALLAVVIGAPNLVYQATHHWPQLTMGRALARNNGGVTRPMVVPFQILLLGPPLAPVWIAGLVALLRRRQWQPIRFLGIGFLVLVVLTEIIGAQFYYPFGLLTVIYAIGCVPAADFLHRAKSWWPRATVGLFALNGVVSVLIALPLLPASMLANTPIPGINQTAGDQIGWPTYVRQIATVYRSLTPAEQAITVVIASNYGEAGAVTRYGPGLGLPKAYSGQNELYFDARPPDSTRTAVVVGDALSVARSEFGSCVVKAHLDSGTGVDNEEQGKSVAICTDPRQQWRQLWPAFQHYD